MRARLTVSLAASEGVECLTSFEGGSQILDDAENREDALQEHKRWLVKAARMYAMCQKAEVAEPMDVTGLAIAAFEDMPLKQALVFVRSNEQNIEDLAWAFRNSSSAEEFERRVKEIKNLPDRGGGASYGGVT
jgi:predicted metal-dependent hydrolase